MRLLNIAEVMCPFIHAIFLCGHTKNNSDMKICTHEDSNPPPWIHYFLLKYFRKKHTVFLYKKDCDDYFFDVMPLISENAIVTGLLELRKRVELRNLILSTRKETINTIYIFVKYQNIDVLQSIGTGLYPSKLIRWIVLVYERQKAVIPKELNSYNDLVCHIVLVHEKNLKNPTIIMRIPTIPDENGVCNHANITTSLTSSDKDDFVRYMNKEDDHYLFGKVLRISWIDQFPYFYSQDGANSSDRQYGGVDYQIIHVLAEYYRFSYEFVPADGNVSGERLSQITNETEANYTNYGNWTGMIGMMIQGEIDVGVTHVSMTSEREKVVDFSYPYLYDGVAFITKEPGQISRALAVIRPFCTEVWISIMVAMILISLSAFKIYDDFGIQSDVDWNFWRFLWYFYGGLLQQGGKTVPVGHTRRILISTWWLFAIIMSSAFSGTLMSHILTPVTHQAVDFVEQLEEEMRAGRYKAGTLEGSAVLNVMKDAINSKYGAMALVAQMIKNDHKDTVVPADSKPGDWVLERPYAFIFDRTLLQAHVIHFGENRFHFSRDQYYTTYCAIMVAEKSSLTDYFNKVLLRLIEGGFVYKWLEDEMFKERIKYALANYEESLTQEPLKLSDLVGAFVAFGIGNGAALIALCGEMMIYYRIITLPAKKLNLEFVPETNSSQKALIKQKPSGRERNELSRKIV